MLNELAFAGFAVSALAWLGLAGLLLSRGAPRGPGRALVIAVSLQAVWSALLAMAARSPGAATLAIPLAEAARGLAWIVFMLSLLRAGEGPGQLNDAPRVRAVRVGLVAASMIAATGVGLWLLGASDRATFIVRLLFAVYALVCVEQFYRNTPTDGRWALKFLAIALVAMFGYELALYSDALLFSRLNQALWSARGFANAMLMPLVAVAAARNREWKVDVGISRAVVFHTTTLMVAGSFLILMALGGYWLRYAGGQWGEVAQAIVLFAALVGVLVVLGSGTLRAHLRVFLAKNFFSYRFDYRAEWLRLTELLSGTPQTTGPDTAGASLETRALMGLCTLIDSRGGALWLAGDDGAFVCATRWQYTEPVPALPADDPLPAFLRSTQWVIDLPQWRQSPQTYSDLRLHAQIADNPENWLIVPLTLHDQLTGFAVLAAPLVSAPVNWEVRDALRVAARQVASHIGVRRAVEALVQARQFESFNRMSAFVVHDLKNLVAQLSLLMANASRHRDNPEFQQDMLDTVNNVLGRMQGLLLQLRAGTRPIDKPSAVGLLAAVESALASKSAMLPVPVLEAAPDAAGLQVAAHRDRLERVVGHLVQNAAEATPRDGSIRVRVAREGERALIEVADTGHGMSETFVRERLFKAFQSTKEHGMGIGTFESREYIQEIGGTLEVDSREGAGTRVCIRLPRIASASDAGARPAANTQPNTGTAA